MIVYVCLTICYAQITWLGIYFVMRVCYVSHNMRIIVTEYLLDLHVHVAYRPASNHGNLILLLDMFAPNFISENNYSNYFGVSNSENYSRDKLSIL